MMEQGSLQSIFCPFFRRRSTISAVFPHFYEKKTRFSIRGKYGAGAIHHKQTMKSKKNLTRFTYESAAFEGWRLCISRAGTTFTRYFPDKKFGGGKKSLAAAEKTLADLKVIIEGAKRVDNKLTPATIKKAEKLLAEAV
jgi:hypothetical protein